MTPFTGQPVTRQEAWTFAKAVMAAWPGATWTVFDSQGAGGVRSPVRTGG